MRLELPFTKPGNIPPFSSGSAAILGRRCRTSQPLSAREASLHPSLLAKLLMRMARFHSVSLHLNRAAEHPPFDSRPPAMAGLTVCSRSET